MRRFAWILALLAAACVSLPAPPAVNLAGVDVESVGLFEQRFRLKLRIRNPNPVDIPVEWVRFDVDLNGRHFASGASPVGVTIPREGEAVLEVRASSDLAAFLNQWQELERAGRPGLDYRVKGILRVSGYGEFPFEQRGEAPFPRLPVPQPKPKAAPGAV